VVLASLLVCFFVNRPEELSREAFHMIIIFIATTMSIMLDICEPCAILLLSMTIGCLTGVLQIGQCFSGFSNNVPWVIFLALSLSSVVTKTSLGMRLAYLFLKLFGRSITGLSYSIIATEFLIAPIIPSNTARGANVGLPIITSISRYVTANIPEAKEKDIGAYLAILYAYSNAICSAMFITAMISNSIITTELEKLGINMNWFNWFKFMIVPGICILVILPIILRPLCKRNVRNVKNVQEQASKKYAEMGKLTSQEKCILTVFVCMLLMWVFSDYFEIPVFVTILIGISIFILTGLLDVRTSFSSFGIISPTIMIGIMISYVNCLISFGAIDWFNIEIAASLAEFGKNGAFFILTLAYYFTHYFFSGEGSRIIALYGAFLSTGIAIGLSPLNLGMTLAFFSASSDVLAHYTCPVAITMFSTGYVTASQWLKTGLLVTALVVTIWYPYIMW
jgi:DASS family divalent anion:Na+ symporter